MDFYTAWAKYYDDVFPYNPKHLEFLNTKGGFSHGATVLDIGCSTGSLALALSRAGGKVTGIDLSEALLAEAEAKKTEVDSTVFTHMNMLDVHKHFEAESIDLISCFGNTLVHLSGEHEIAELFTRVYSVLKKNGRLAMQIVNYDRIMARKPSGLATIDNNAISFERLYTYEESGHISFAGNLSIKDTGERLSNTVLLYPVFKNTLEQLLSAAGFRNIDFYGNFMGEPYTIESVPLIFVAQK